MGSCAVGWHPALCFWVEMGMLPAHYIQLVTLWTCNSCQHMANGSTRADW